MIGRYDDWHGLSLQATFPTSGPCSNAVFLARHQEVQNLDGLGANFATQFCWAGMYGGVVSGSWFASRLTQGTLEIWGQGCTTHQLVDHFYPSKIM